MLCCGVMNVRCERFHSYSAYAKRYGIERKVCLCVIHQGMYVFFFVVFTCDTLVINFFAFVGVLVIVVLLLCRMLAC